MAVGRPFGCIIASILAIVAGVILLIGALVTAKDINYLRAHWTQIYGLAIYCTVISILVMIGAVGLLYVVSRQFPALTTLFSGFLIFVAFLAIICVTILITARNDLQRKTYDKTQRLFGNYSNENLPKTVKEIVDRIQRSYQCCGIEQASDWTNEFTDHTSVPDSCCQQVVPGCGRNALTTASTNIYLHGCASILFDDLRKKYSALIAMNIILAVFALLSAIFGIIYERNIRQQYQSM